MNYSHCLLDDAALSPFVSGMRQLASIRSGVFDDGGEAGVRFYDIDNGSGLRFTVLRDRGMDIGELWFKGVQLAFLTPCGFRNPAHFAQQPGIDGWLRSWGGGLLTGCGLRNAGGPSTLDGESFGLHGRLSNIPAERCRVDERWMDGRYRLHVEGSMREARFFGENLLLTRKISCEMGRSEIVVEDTVRNEGARSSHFELLYHINLGFPLLSEHATMVSVPHTVAPRDSTAAEGLADWARFPRPVKGYQEQCFYHDIPEEADGFARISLLNPSIGLRMELSYRKAELPFLTEWKQMGHKEYALGLEPGNCHVEGVAREDAMGSLRHIEPGESVTCTLSLAFSEIA